VASGQEGVSHHLRLRCRHKRAAGPGHRRRGTVSVAAHLESEPEFKGTLRFDRQRWAVVVNDRIGAGSYRMARQANPRELFRVLIS